MKNNQLGLWQVVSLGIGSIVGAGIFALLGQVLREAGNFTYLSFAVSGIIAMFCGYAYVKLAAAYPQAGGITDYFHHAFPSKFASGTLSLVYVFTTLISAGALAKSFGFYMVSLLPHTPFLTVNACAAVMLVGLGILNMLKARDVGSAEAWLVAFKLGILGLLIAAGVYKFDHYTPAFTTNPGVNGFFQSIGLTFFAFAGFGVITNAAAYVKDPGKTIRAAMFLTLFIVMLLYIGLAFVIMNYMSVEQFDANVNVSVAVVAKKLLGEPGSFLIYAAAVMAFMTGISASFFSVFRVTKSLAEQRILPAFYKKTLWNRGTYGNALSLTLLTLFTIFFGFNDIVNLSSMAYLISYLGVFASAWILRRQTKARRIPLFIGFTAMAAILVGFVYSVYFS